MAFKVALAGMFLNYILCYMSLWDAHVHCYPDWIRKNPEKWAVEKKETHWWSLHSQKIQSWFSPEKLIDEMDSNGVERVVVLGWYWENPENCNSWNDWALELRDDYDGRFIPFASVHPKLGKVKGGLAKVFSGGFAGLGECLPHIQGAAFTDKNWLSICERAEAMNLPINLHITEPVGHDYAGRVDTPLQELLDLIIKFPKQKWILSHWGGGLPFFILNQFVKKSLRNVWVDSSASPLLYQSEIWQMVLRLLGADRILFGSDFPLNLYPRSQSEAKMGLFIEEFQKAIEKESDYKKIASENLKSLLRR